MRIELTTLGLLDPRSNQLSYEGFQWPQKPSCVWVRQQLARPHPGATSVRLASAPGCRLSGVSGVGGWWRGRGGADRSTGAA